MEVAIVGGGAAGLFAAWQAARSGCRVRLLERGNRVGRKLLLTGSGRCNLSNERAGDARYYHGSVAVAPALRALPPAELERQLGQLGLALRRDHAGRIYPWSGQAASVLDALRFGAAAAGAELLTGAGVVAVTPAHRRFILTLENGRRMTADRVIFCPGGRAAPDTGSDGSALALLAPLGHAPTALRPGLVPLRTDPALLRGMEGQRLQGRAAFFRAGREIAARTGEIQLTRSGAVSGICVLDLAREALGQEQEELRLDLLPECSRDQVLQLLGRAPGPTLADRLGGLINKRVAAMLADRKSVV